MPRRAETVQGWLCLQGSVDRVHLGNDLSTVPMTAVTIVYRTSLAMIFFAIIAVFLLPFRAWPACRHDCRTAHQTLIDNYCGAIQCFQDGQACLADAQDSMNKCL